MIIKEFSRHCHILLPTPCFSHMLLCLDVAQLFILVNILFAPVDVVTIAKVKGEVKGITIAIYR